MKVCEHLQIHEKHLSPDSAEETRVTTLGFGMSLTHLFLKAASFLNAQCKPAVCAYCLTPMLLSSTPVGCA